MKPPIIECAHCGQLCVVGLLGPMCGCTPKWSAYERHRMAAGLAPEPPLSSIPPLRRAA